MTLEIREPVEDELADLAFAVAYSFDAERSPDALEATRRLFRILQPLAAFEDGRLVSCLGIAPFAMAANGGDLPFGGIGSVACLPEERRKGYVGKLLRRALELMRERGQVLSGLYTPHYALYRRFGWMVACHLLRYSFAPKDIALTPNVRPRGEARRVSNRDWAALDDVYRRFIDRRNGYLRRSEHWWRAAVLRSLYAETPGHRDAAVWVGEDGRWMGYVVYSTKRTGEWTSQFTVRDFVALDADAYRGLLTYILQHDLNSEMTWFAPVNDPLPSIVDDPARVKTHLWPGMMLRLVDVAKAVAGRPCLVDRPGRKLVLEVTDDAAPWNEGRWRLEAESGRVEVTKTDEAPDLSTDVSVLAALFSGHLSATEAARSGLLTAQSGSALETADRIFAPRCAPFAFDWF